VIGDITDRCWQRKHNVVDMSFPAGQSNLNLYPSGDCSNGTQRKRDKTTFTRTRTRQ
jgi:hypothetical protein